MVIRDNRCLLHYTNYDEYPQRRRVEAITANGAGAFGVDPLYQLPFIERPLIELSGQDRPP